MLLDFAHSLMFLKNTTFRELDLLPSSGTIMLGPLQRASLRSSEGPNIVGIDIILLEDGNRSIFRNVLFFKTLDDGQSPEI
jgi:hypothetical protein